MLDRPLRQGFLVTAIWVAAFCVGPASLFPHSAAADAPAAMPAAPSVTLPMGRTVYFVGETVPLAIAGEGPIRVALDDGRRVLPAYEGADHALLLDTAALAPGDYTVQLADAATPTRFTLVDTLATSPGLLVDESKLDERSWPTAKVPADQALRESGVGAMVYTGSRELGRDGSLNTLARTGTLALANPMTRPTSFNPIHVDPRERRGMLQTMALSAQANAMYPNFGGFLYDWDPTGYQPAGRKMLLVYWGWGKQVEALRTYIEGQDALLYDTFRTRTGLEPVMEDEYLRWCMATGHPEYAPVIDMPTRRWVRAMAGAMTPMPEGERAAFERRLDAWSAYLMGIYREVYQERQLELGEMFPSMRHTSSVQIDHQRVRFGQYLPAANEPLDLRYQSTWNDQIGHPDYAWQTLFTAGLLEIDRGDKVSWMPTASAAVYGGGVAKLPGKLTRDAARNLAYGGTATGFALEAFSTVMGGLGNAKWYDIRGDWRGEEVRAASEFLQRFSFLATEGQARHGVGVLYSRAQMGRETRTVAFGDSRFNAFIALARLGRTPRFVTEEQILRDGLRGLPALLIVGQNVPLPADVMARLAEYQAAGGRILTDSDTHLDLPGAESVPVAFQGEFMRRPYNNDAPDYGEGDNDRRLGEVLYQRVAPALAQVLGDTGCGPYLAAKGTASEVALFTIDGSAGPGVGALSWATYVVMTNESYVDGHLDWRQLAEPLRSTLPLIPGADYTTVYDLCAEQRLGGDLRALQTDLRQLPARVLAVLRAPVGPPRILASQQVTAGSELAMSVDFPCPVSYAEVAAGAPTPAALPFRLTLTDPSGATVLDLRRATQRDGRFEFAHRIPANAPAGVWQLTVHSQLDGAETTLPITVAAAPAATAPAAATVALRPLGGSYVRDPAGIGRLLQQGPIRVPFFSARQAELRPAADAVVAALKARGLDAALWIDPPVGVFHVGYALSPEEAAANALAESGQCLGAYKVATVNSNNWESNVAGYRVAGTLVLLDLVGKADNPLAEQAVKLGTLWPAASASFPGPGRALVQPVFRAFSPDHSVLVIQAADAASLLAGITALDALPADATADPDALDPIGTGVRAARARLWTQRHVGGRPAQPAAAALTAANAATTTAPAPFAIAYGDHGPLALDAPAPQKPLVLPAFTVPALVEQAQLQTLAFNDAGALQACWNPGGTWRGDLRFADALAASIQSDTAQTLELAFHGQFRYSDKVARSAPQWETVIALYKASVTPTREPMSVEVRIDGAPVGSLLPVAVETRDIPIDTPPSHGAGATTTVSEEVVLELRGSIAFPAGAHRLELIPRNTVDGRLDYLRLGITPDEAAAELLRRHPPKPAKPAK